MNAWNAFQGDCTVRLKDEQGRFTGDKYAAFIRIARATFEEKFSPWFGAVQLSVSPHDFTKIHNHGASIKLESGRCGSVCWRGGRSEEPVLLEGHDPGGYQLLYFVGITECPLD